MVNVRRFLLAVLIALLLPNAVMAQGNSGNSQQNGNQGGTTTTNQSDNASDKSVQNKSSERCVRVGNLIQNRLMSYDENRERHLERHQNIINTVETLVANLKKKGYDTTNLELQIQEMKKMMEEFRLSFQNFADKMAESEAYACDENKGDFLRAMEQAKMQIKDAQDKATEMLDYVRNVVRPEMQALKAQKPSL